MPFVFIRTEACGVLEETIKMPWMTGISWFEDHRVPLAQILTSPHQDASTIENCFFSCTL